MKLATLLSSASTIKGGAIIARLLAAEGVDTVFGIIDGTYTGMYANFKPNGIKLITPRHETIALHMAGAYARVTGRLGVCMASNGPGVANALPGVAVEHAEGNRVLLITSSRRAPIIYPDRGGTFQYFPQVDVIRPMSKWSCAVPSVERLAEIMRKAFRMCYAGRPGVVHVDVPESIMNGDFELDASWFREVPSYRVSQAVPPRRELVRAAAQMLAGAERPVIHAGSGIVHAHASAELHAVAELLGAPIVTSWGGRAGVDERKPQAIPMYSIDTVNRARREADVILVLGSRLGETDWWAKPPYWGAPDVQRMIQVDLDPESLGVSRAVELAIHAEVKEFLVALKEELVGQAGSARLAGRREFLASLREDLAAHRAKLDKHLRDVAMPMNPAHAPAACRAAFDDDAIVVMDGGNTAVWANFYFEMRAPYTQLGTFKMGMLGAGVGQALGAQAAFPRRQVVCLIGDGAMGMQQQELETAVRNQLPVIFLVLCDKQWGMVKMNQQFALKPLKTLLLKSLGPDETINADLCETRFDELARAMGAHGERVADPSGLRGAIDRAKASGRCAVIHVDVDPVKHMWAPALRAFKDMHDEPKG